MPSCPYRISLRPFGPADIPTLVGWNRKVSVKELLRWAGPVFSHPLTSEQVSAYLEQLRQGELYLIEADGVPAGIIELGSIRLQHRNARIGKVLIGNKAYRRKGVAREAVGKVLQIAFEEMRLHKVSLAVLAENQRAVRTYLRSGFTEEGRFLEHRYADGRWFDLIEMGILRSSWLDFTSRRAHYQFTTERLVLRTSLIDDADRALDYYQRNRTFLAAYGPVRAPEFYTRTYQERMIIEELKKLRDGSALRFWLCLRDEPDRFIGTVSVSQIIRGNFRSCFIGYQLDREMTRRGYMSEGLERILELIFGELHLHRVEASIMPDNTPSRKLAEKLGFREEGAARRYLLIDGRWVDHIHYTLLAEDLR